MIPLDDVDRPAVPAQSGAVESGVRGEPGSVDAELAALSDLPLAGHAAVYERLHTRLQSALSAIDA